MNFFEQELRKIVEPVYPDASYIGRACYVRLGNNNRAKIHFSTGEIASHYNALQMTILDRREGKLDTLRVRLHDLLGTKQVSNPNFRNGVDPHIWENSDRIDWYAYRPSRADYEKLTETVSEYLELFQEQDIAPQWEQTM